jgi:nucleoside-diphosphate-sugar epimerase
MCAETDNGAGQVYIIAGQRPVTIETLVHMIAEALEVQPPALRLPVTMGKVAGYGLQLAFKPLGRQPPFSRRSVDFFLKDNAYDIGKAKNELGFEPQVDLRAGLVETRSWLNKPANDETK